MNDELGLIYLVLSDTARQDVDYDSIEIDVELVCVYLRFCKTRAKFPGSTDKYQPVLHSALYLVSNLLTTLKEFRIWILYLDVWKRVGEYFKRE